MAKTNKRILEAFTEAMSHTDRHRNGMLHLIKTVAPFIDLEKINDLKKAQFFDVRRHARIHSRQMGVTEETAFLDLLNKPKTILVMQGILEEDEELQTQQQKSRRSSKLILLPKKDLAIAAVKVRDEIGILPSAHMENTRLHLSRGSYTWTATIRQLKAAYDMTLSEIVDEHEGKKPVEKIFYDNDTILKAMIRFKTESKTKNLPGGHDGSQCLPEDSVNWAETERRLKSERKTSIRALYTEYLLQNSPKAIKDAALGHPPQQQQHENRNRAGEAFAIVMRALKYEGKLPDITANFNAVAIDKTYKENHNRFKDIFTERGFEAPVSLVQFAIDSGIAKKEGINIVPTNPHYKGGNATEGEEATKPISKGRPKSGRAHPVYRRPTEEETYNGLVEHQRVVNKLPGGGGGHIGLPEDSVAWPSIITRLNRLFGGAAEFMKDYEARKEKGGNDLPAPSNSIKDGPA